MKLSALHRKLLRDLVQAWGQALAIALVMAAGVGMLVMYRSTFSSLRFTQETYYQRYRFAEVFASLERAPESLLRDIRAIPGVARAESRVVRDVLLDIPDLEEPATGRLISVPGREEARLNDVFLRRGRYLQPDRSDEVLVSEAFALARGLGPGDRVKAILNGRRRDLRIVGVAMSPEYVYSIRPADFFPDPSRFGVFWMERRALAAAFDLDGAFNDVSLTLSRGAQEDEVIAQLDRLLDPYGGFGAIPRSLQISHWYLDNELTGLQGAGLVVPLVFLAVATFLLNVVLKRMVTVQREQVAALKALGYSNLAVGVHYAQWSLAVALGGGFLGVGFGAWLGVAMARIYTQYFSFPTLNYQLSLSLILGALAVSAGAALLGAWGGVRKAVSLPPAEAMRPEPPALYRPTLLERLGLGHRLTEPVRMILRHLERQPFRAGISILGIAFAAAIMVVGTFGFDAIGAMMDLQFFRAQRQDMTVIFARPASGRALHEIQRLPGVVAAEPLRGVPARLIHGHRSRLVSIQGLVTDARLQRLVDIHSRPRPLPQEGVVLSSKLGEILHLKAGDVATLQVLEGKRQVLQVPVRSLVEEAMGTSVTMDLDALARLLGQSRTLSGAVIQADEAQARELYRVLKATPAVAGVVLREAVLESFNKTVAQNLGLITFFNVLFASVIAFGIIYNNARISLSERSRDLASLRVLGFTRGEISFILLGELGFLTVLAVPLGLVLGYGLAQWMVLAFENELYRLPAIVAPRTYALAALTVFVASAASALVVRRRLDHLDLVAVLKTRE